MTDSKPGQGAHVTKLRSLREQYDRDTAELDREYKFRRDILKNPIREAIREGLELNMPQRRIYHDGLGMGQATQLYSFLGMPAASNAEKLREHLSGNKIEVVEARVSEEPRTITVLSDTQFALVDSSGIRRNIPYKRSGHLAHIFLSQVGLNEDQLDIIQELRPAWNVFDTDGNLMWEPEPDMEAFMAYQNNKGGLIK